MDKRTAIMTTYNHISRTIKKDIVQKRIDTLKIGQKMQDLPEELWHESFRHYVKEDKTRRGGPNMRLIRLDPNKPSLTVTGFIFNKFVHPFEDRFVTVREAARLQDFPDDMEIIGSLTSTQRQIGNAVPVLLAKAIFQSIVDFAAENKYPQRNLKGFSLFCGAGGLDLGAEMAFNKEYGIRTSLAIDNWDDACRTLKNYTGERTNVIQENVNQVESPLEFWLKNTNEVVSPDIIYGGPPCQAFSQAGKQKALDDDRGKLVFEFLRFIDDIRPSFFVMENVSNIVSICEGRLYREILDGMKSCGYNVSFGVLNAAEFGTPQLRRRAVFIGTKKDLGQVPLPVPTHSETMDMFGLPLYSTVGEAFAGLPNLMSYSNVFE